MKKVLALVLSLIVLLGLSVPVASAETAYMDVESLTDAELDTILANGVDQRSALAKEKGLNIRAGMTTAPMRMGTNARTETQVATLLLDRQMKADGTIQESYVTIARGILYQGTDSESYTDSTQSLTAYIYIYYDYQFDDDLVGSRTRLNRSAHKVDVHSSSIRATSMLCEHNWYNILNDEANLVRTTVSSPVSGRTYTCYPHDDTWLERGEATYMGRSSGYTNDGGVASAYLEFVK